MPEYYGYITVIVENTTNIKAWIPVLIEMIKTDIGIIEVYAPIPFNEEYTDLLIGTVDQSNYSIQINTTVQEFNQYLNFFAERTKEGDIISVWKSVEELDELIDEKAENPAQRLEKELEEQISNPEEPEDEIPSEIKLSTPEELAEEIISFAKKEFPDQDDRRDIHGITHFFWKSKNIKKWNLPDIQLELKIEKAERLAQKQLISEIEVKEKGQLSSLVDPCVDWAKENGLKKVTEADVETFLFEKDKDVSPRTKRRDLQKMVNRKLEKEKPELSSLVNPCIDWAKEHGLKNVTEADVETFLFEKDKDVSPRTKRRALQEMVNNILKAKSENRKLLSD